MNAALPWSFLQGFIQGAHERGMTDREIAGNLGEILGDPDLMPNRETVARWRRGECKAGTLNRKALQAWVAKTRSER